jgi:hypothetical protein
VYMADFPWDLLSKMGCPMGRPIGYPTVPHELLIHWSRFQIPVRQQLLSKKVTRSCHSAPEDTRCTRVSGPAKGSKRNAKRRLLRQVCLKYCITSHEKGPSCIRLKQTLFTQTQQRNSVPPSNAIFTTTLYGCCSLALMRLGARKIN